MQPEGTCVWLVITSDAADRAASSCVAVRIPMNLLFGVSLYLVDDGQAAAHFQSKTNPQVVLE